MIKIKYPSLEIVEKEIASLSDLYENHISVMTEEESEEFSIDFYDFLEKVENLALRYNLNPEQVCAYYKGFLFLQLVERTA